MPKRPYKQCSKQGCPEKSNGGLCKKHKRKVFDKKRGSSASRGYGHRWRQNREIFLRNNPLCISCLSTGMVTAAKVVDHIVPHRGDKDLFDDQENWQPLCVSCHNFKTASGK